MNKTLTELLGDIRGALIAYESFVDKVLEVDEGTFHKANAGDFPAGNTVLGVTFFAQGTRPLDKLNVLEGYLAAKLEV